MAESKLKSRVKGSSILEVVIAMVVIVAVFGIALMIFSNVMRSSLSVKKIRAQAIAQQLLLRTEAQRTFTDTAFLSGDLRFERSARPYTENNGLTEIRVTALDSHKDTLITAAKIIIRP
jgi:Tfp pilus assembly protein PilV